MRLAHTTHDYDGMHAQRTTKPFQSNPIQKHCYMIIDRSYMTETMLIVILSTNAPTKRTKIKAINNKKKKKNILFLFLFGRVRTCAKTVFVLCSLHLPDALDPSAIWA